MHFPEGKEIYRIQSEHRTIIVSQENELRTLRIDPNNVQGAMSLKAPQKLILSYMELMMSFLLFQRRPRQVLMLGLGSGDMIRYLHYALPKAAFQVVEADSALVHICREYFFLPNSDNVEITTAHAEQFMASTRKKFDTLLVDLFSHPDTLPPPLLDADFYKRCSDRLRADGIMVMNLITDDADQFRRILWDIRQAFEHLTLCLAVPEHKNVIIMAFKKKPGPLTQAELLKKARRLSTTYGQDFTAAVGNLFVTNPLEHDELILG